MPATGTSRGRHVLVAAVVAGALAIGPLAQPASAQEFRGTVLRLVNAARAHHGLRPLALNRSLSQEARAHSRTMLRRNRIFDPPDLERLLAPYPVDHLGAAAVGCEDTLRALQRAFLRSDAHRRILLHPQLRRVGIGVVRADGPNLCGGGSFWVTEVFYG